MDVLPPADDNLISFLGKRDKILPDFTKWPLYELDIEDRKGLWFTFAKKLDILDEKKKLLTPTLEEIDDFYYKNSDIEFEIIYSRSLVNKNFIFKIKDKIYSYAIGKKSKKSKKIYYARFFFNFKDFLITDLFI